MTLRPDRCWPTCRKPVSTWTDRTIESMGYVETYDGSGFFYDRIW